MKQTALLDVGAKPPWSCPLCGGTSKKLGRCRPCFIEPPAPGGPAHARWTRGIFRVVRTKLAHLPDRVVMDTWEALLLDNREIPPEAAPYVADIARLPFSARRYKRVVDQALTRAHIGYRLAEQGICATPADPHKVDNVAGRAAALIWAQRDRVTAGEDFERVHDAEFVEQALLEHEARELLVEKGWRKGTKSETEVARLVKIAMRDVRGSYGRPSDEYPAAARVVAESFRIAPLDLRVDDGAEAEAAELESAESARGAMR